MNFTFIRFLSVTLFFALLIGLAIYWAAGQRHNNLKMVTSEQENMFLTDVQYADSLHRQLKKTNPTENPSEFSAVRFRLDEIIRRMEKGYGGDSLFRALASTTGLNYRKLVALVIRQDSSRQNRFATKEQLTLQIETLTSAVQALQMQVISKRTSVDNIRAMKSSKP